MFSKITYVIRLLYFRLIMTELETNNKHLKIAVGSDDFRDVITGYDVFVDKTLFIKEIN